MLVVAFALGFKASFVDKLQDKIPDEDTKTYRELGPVNLLLAPEIGQLRDTIKDALQVASKRLYKKVLALDGNEGAEEPAEE